MKSTFLFFLLCITIVASSSCKHTTEPNGTTPVRGGIDTAGSKHVFAASATVNGEPWVVSDSSIYFGGCNGYVTIAKGDTVIVLKPSSGKVGTYTSSFEYDIDSAHTLKTRYLGTSGTYTITRSDGDVGSGTFSFHAKASNGDSVVITNGSYIYKLGYAGLGSGINQRAATATIIDTVAGDTIHWSAVPTDGYLTSDQHLDLTFRSLDCISLQLDLQFTSPGAYDLSDGNQIRNALLGFSGLGHDPREGKVTLTSMQNDTARGTFNFTADQYVVKDGKFSVHW